MRTADLELRHRLGNDWACIKRGTFLLFLKKSQIALVNHYSNAQGDNHGREWASAHMGQLAGIAVRRSMLQAVPVPSLFMCLFPRRLSGWAGLKTRAPGKFPFRG